jgi:hypothetical protein
LPVTSAFQDVVAEAIEKSAHDKEEADEEATALKEAVAMAPAATLEEKEAAFWEAQEKLTAWKIPFGLNRNRMPWLADGQTGLGVAMARCRSQGKTPLIVDPSFDGIAEHHFTSEALGSKVLRARSMFEDEAKGLRSHSQVMDDTRKLLVEAMREGKTFYIQLEKKNLTDFAGGVYSSQDTLPLAIFDQRVLAELEPYFSDSDTAKSAEPTWSGLWGSEHPFAAVLRESDCDSSGRFLVGRGFEVVVGTTKKVDEFVQDLRNVIPMGRLQAILPMPGPL